MTTKANEASIISLPELHSEYAVTPEQVAGLRQDGHVLLRGVCTPEEIAAYRSAVI